MTTRRHVATAIGLALIASAEAANQPKPATKPGLTVAQLVDIRHPSAPLFSPDGRHVAFLWERAGVANLYISPSDGSAPPRQLTRFTEGAPASVAWSPDGTQLHFTSRGDLWRVALSPGAEPVAVWSTPGPETSLAYSSDRSHVAFARPAADGTELFIRSLATGEERRVAAELGPVGAITWSTDRSRLAFSVVRAIRHEETPSYAGSKLIYTITERPPAQAFTVSATGGPIAPLGPPGGFGGLRWSSPSHVVFDRTSPDFKRRTIFRADATRGTLEALHEDRDEKFWSPTGDAGASGQVSPDGRFVLFVSDRDGWDHIYVKPLATLDSVAVQLTRGAFEAWRPQWSPDGKRIAFDANEPARPGVRHLGIVTLGDDPAQAKVAMITTGRGTNIAPLWSPQGDLLVFQRTDSRNSADLYTIEARSGAQPRRLTDSLPEGLDRDGLVEPELVSYPGADGQKVPAYLFKPRGFDPKKKYPAIVWIHGDGVNQNYDGWHVQRNYAVYYSFHQYLLQKGYVVVTPDYRGSIGYGRDWRQGVYMDVGGKDAKDAWLSANYLKTLPYVDPGRIGAWGLSYGGFFTLIAMTEEPTLFRAGVNVAGPVDYAMYYGDPYRGGWTASRIGTPEQNPEVYAKASPLSKVARLERPLLVLHGTSDVNVPYLHSVRLIDELLKKDKGRLVDFMEYPGEFHYFTREHVLKDAWARVERFFGEHLKAEITPR